jgi:ankyrin repeat protein
LPELGPTDALRQRLDGVDPWIAARRLLDILASVDVAHSPGLGRPKLLLVVDQLELALDGARLEAPEVASEWMAFLQVLAALGDALLDPAMREALEETAKRVGDRLPCAVVLGLPADRSSAFGAALRPGDLVFPLPRLVDETALREVVTGTFAALGLTIEPEARESLCREAVSLAEGTEASILPLLGVTLTALHDEWKIRCELEAKWKEYADDLTTMPMSLVLLGVIPPGDSRVDIALKHVNEHGRIDKAMARLGELAWNEAEEKEPWIKRNLVSLPITSQRQQVESGEITARDFALAWLLRHLVSVSADETIRLKSLPDHSLEAFARPMAEALRRHRLLTRRDDGTWWLAHQAVLVNWPRAAKWKEAEMQIYRTMATMEMDRRRWLEEREAGDFDAGRWLWMRERQVERAIEWMFLLGMHDNPDLAMFAKEGMIASVAQDGIRAGRILRVAAYLNDAAWSEAILQAAVSNATAASNELNKNGDGSALKNACLHGNTTLVRLLMQHGAHPDLVHANGWTPLLLAAQVGASEVCDLLLAAGAEVNHATKDGWTALMVAAQNGHDTVVAQLLAAGADVSHVSSDGWTALKIAAQNGHGAIVASLLATGADIGDATSNGWTALTGAAENGHDAVVAHLLSAGANVNRVTNDGWTALTMASENGHDTVVAHLLAARADVNHVTNDGWTALNCAAKNGHDLIVALLVSAGAAVDNAADKEQRVALILAAENGHYAVVDCLLSLGAKVDHEDCGGRTALIVASQNGHYAVVERLIAAEAKVPHGTNRKSSALIKAAEGGHEVVITLLIAAGAEANHVDANGSSALLKAVQNGNKAIAARLITSRPNANLGNVEGATALTEAIMNRDKEMVQLLLSHGADPMLQNNTDLSALEIAHKRNAKSIIKLLVEAGVPPLSEDELHILQSKRIKEGNIGLVVNARGKVCLVHDFKFLATPLLVGYHVDKKQIEIFYDTGESYPIEWEATDEMHNLLSKIDKILLIRMKEKRPVEGYDTSFLIMRTGKPIESESEVPPSPEGELQNIQREPIKKATSALSSTHSEKSA